MIRFSSIFFLVLFGLTAAAQQTNEPAKNNFENESPNLQLNNSNNVLNENMLNSPSQDVKSQLFYRTESDNLEQQVKKEAATARTWLNLYKSSLYSYYNGSSKTLTAQQKQELTDIVNEMKLNVPGTYEYNLAVYMNGQHNTDLIPYLAKAEIASNNDIDVIEQFVAYYAITGNDNKCKEYVGKHRKISDYEGFIEEYAYNLLKSVDDNAILFTHGIMDTYPLYYQQYNQKAGAGVEIINIDYLSSEEYRKNLEKKLGITFGYTGNNYAAAFEIAGKMKNTRSVYFSNAFAKTELKKHLADLELSGLAMQYGATQTNAGLLETRWKNFKIQHLQKADMKDDYSRKMSANYQPALVTLHKYYTSAGLKKEAEEVKNIALKIARVNGTEKQVASLLN